MGQTLTQRLENWFNPLTWLFPGYTGQANSEFIVKQYVTNKIMQNSQVIDYKVRQKLIESEGDRNDVYRDSRGLPTVGIGHLVTPLDFLKVGDVITNAKKEEFYRKDSRKAIDAAWVQSQILKKENNENFVVALAEVNYQLGTGWYKKFPKTWEALKTAKWQLAIGRLNQSLWARQTPTRVNNFKQAIQEAFA